MESWSWSSRPNAGFKKVRDYFISAISSLAVVFGILLGACKAARVDVKLEVFAERMQNY